MTEKQNHFKFKDGKPIGVVVYARDNMTEKRYFKEDFYNEYAIKKEDTIIAIVDSGTNARKICDELNNLYEENQHLQKMNELLIAEIRWNKEQKLQSRDKTPRITPKEVRERIKND